MIGGYHSFSEIKAPRFLRFLRCAAEFHARQRPALSALKLVGDDGLEPPTSCV
jgi:hypothetical protein